MPIKQVQIDNVKSFIRFFSSKSKRKPKVTYLTYFISYLMISVPVSVSTYTIPLSYDLIQLNKYKIVQFLILIN